MYDKKGFWIGIVLFVLNSFIVYAQPSRFQDRSITQALQFIFKPGPATILLLIIIWILIYFTFMYFFFRRGGKEPGKTGKGICGAASGLIVISMFAFGGGTTIIQRMQEIAGWINLMVGLLLGIGAYFLVTKNSKENNGFAKMFGVALALITIGIFSSFSSNTMENSFMGGLITILLWVGGIGIVWWLLSNSFILNNKMLGNTKGDRWYNKLGRNMNMYRAGANFLNGLPSDNKLAWQREWNAYTGMNERSNEAKSEWDELREFISLQDKEIDDFRKLRAITQAKMDKLVRTVEIWLNAGSTERQIKKAVEYLGGEAHSLFHTTLFKMLDKQLKLAQNMHTSIPLPNSLTIPKLNKYFRLAGRDGFSNDDKKWIGKIEVDTDLEKAFRFRIGDLRRSLAKIIGVLTQQKNLISRGAQNLMLPDNNYENMKTLFNLINREDTLVNQAAHAEIDLYEALMKVKEKVEGKKSEKKEDGSNPLGL